MSRVSNDDVLFGFRLRLFSLAGEIGVRPACRAMGVHHSSYYRWKRKVKRWGLEALRIRERRRPRMPNELGPHLEQRILAFSLAQPGFGPKRIAAELAREKWGGLRISANGVYRVLCRHGLNTRQRRLALVAGYAARYERPPLPEIARHVEASRPGELVGVDCFYIGRLTGTKGRSGSTRRSTSPPASPGRSCTARRRTRLPSTAPRSSSGSPPSSPTPAGGWRR
jgi:transposase